MLLTGLWEMIFGQIFVRNNRLAMRSKKFFLSMFIMFCYCVLIVFLPNFSLYVEFRGYILPFLLSVILTMVNFKTIKGWFDYFAKLLLFIALGYILRLLVFFAFKGYFDVDFRNIEYDWYLLYIIMQIPTIIFSSLLTFVFLKVILKKKSDSLANNKTEGV